MITTKEFLCDSADYNDDWIHFDLSGSDADVLSTFSFPYGTPLQPHDFQRLSDYAKIISDEFHTDRIYREDIIDKVMLIFLCALDEELRKNIGQTCCKNITANSHRSAHRSIMPPTLTGQ